MDDELQNLENELRELRPAAPSRALLAQIERELDSVGHRPTAAGSRWWVWVAALPIAAAVAVMTAIAMNRAPRVTTAESEGRLKPVSAENVLYAASDEGLISLGDGTPARRARLNYVDTFTWENPRTNASLRWSVPREEVRIVPVAFQ
jgi:hypothetical protein